MSRDRLLAFVRFNLVFHLVFDPVYFGLRMLRPPPGLDGWRLYFEFETAIPHVPWMIWPYASLFSAFMLPLFHLGPAQMDRLARQMAVAMVVAAVAFMAVPARLGFPPLALDGFYGGLFAALRGIDAPDNLVPSLHVTNMALLVWAVPRTVAARLRTAYGLWLALVAVAAVLVHQHHLLDVAAGLALAVLVRRLLPLAGAAGEPAAQEAGQ